MQDVISTLQANAAWAVFLNVMLNQGGLPLPALPTVLAAAALSTQHPNRLAAVVMAGVSGALLGDLVQYWCGKRFWAPHSLHGLQGLLFPGLLREPNGSDADQGRPPVAHFC
jgi:membrane protein DedA with SNARE-associated domain